MTYLMRIALAHLPDVLTLTFFSFALLPVMAALSVLEVGNHKFSLYRVDPERLVVVRYDPNRYPLFSGPYRNWATLKTDGKQVQFGKLVPALCVVKGDVSVVEHPIDANGLYRHASLWITAGPVLVRKGKPVCREEVKSEYRHLDTDGLTSRVVLLVWKDGSVGFLFNSHATLWQMQKAAVHLKADYALNLDGGSCTVWQPNNKQKLTGKDVVEGYTWCIGVK